MKCDICKLEKEDVFDDGFSLICNECCGNIFSEIKPKIIKYKTIMDVKYHEK